jgi:hypothetical protein
VTAVRVKVLVETVRRMLTEGAPVVSSDKIHRLDKVDTKSGMNSLLALVSMGVPYAMLLYERFLGRPFAGHRDSVSELIGNSLEIPIETVLDGAEISYRQTRRDRAELRGVVSRCNLSRLRAAQA